MLAGALLSLVDWLLSCIRSGLSSKDGIKDPLDDRITNNSIDILESLLKNDFILAMLYLAKHADAGKYSIGDKYKTTAVLN